MSEAKKILVLGSGNISRPCVQYLLKQGHKVTVVDRYEANVKRTLSNHPNGTAVVGDAVAGAANYIREYQPDVVVDLLPTAFMVPTAKVCVAEGVSMVAASYAKEEMRTLDAEAKAKNVTLLCEFGLDPGVDHMSAVKTIKELHAKGAKVEKFVSICGALPDFGANNNPIGYKLSWAPESLVGASKRSAKIVVDGKVIDWLDGETYQHPAFVEIEGLGWFEAYCNADSTPYLEAYGIQEAKTIMRGTLRFPDWCDMITQMQKLCLFDEDVRDFSGYTYASLMKELAGCKDSSEPVKKCVANFLGIKEYTTAMMKLQWLGLFDEEAVAPQKGSVRDMITAMYGRKLVFGPGEKDLVVMQHQYTVNYPETGKRQKITSTLVDRGVVEEESSIARTTGMPMGIGAHFVATGVVKEHGVLIPTTENIYTPALAALAKEGLHFVERETTL